MLQVAVTGGEVKVLDVPSPVVRARGILVRTSHSAISVGTESSSIGSGGRSENLLVKAIRNPALVRKVMDRVSSHGLKNTADLVRTRMSNEMSAGYSCAGVVLEVGDEATSFRVGDRVACCGVGYANHAAVNFIPQNLAARLPDGVTFEEGAFGTIGAIALQGVRRCAPTLGDRVVVLGLGLIGQLTAQLVRAAGAVAIGIDVLPERLARARALGLSDGFAASQRDLVAGVLERTDGIGADAVIVTAAAPDPGLLNRALDACRKKGRVVLVGDVPIRIQRDKIYKKEIDFLISTSYGPGRYDPEYEEKGVDYPLPYVRWTEGRNLAEVLRLIEGGSLRVKPLIDAVHPIEEADRAYAAIASERKPIGVVLDYHLESVVEAPLRRAHVSTRAPREAAVGSKLGVGVIGCGDYFRGVLLPLLRSHPGFALRSVCSRNGLTVRRAVEKDGFETGTTDHRQLLEDPAIDVVYVATRHDQHFEIAKDAVSAGKAVFVEKPMAMNSTDARELVECVAERKALLTVGFNRRFSPHAVRMKELLSPIADPKVIVYRVNAGALPPDHWLLDPAEGGGRLIGEAVHFFDFVCFLAGSEPIAVHAIAPRQRARDEAIVTLEFADGTIGTVVYTGAGSAASGKERIEVFAGGMTLLLDDFSRLEVHGTKARGLKTRSVEKGQREQLANFHAALVGTGALGVTAEDGYRATWCAERALRSRREPLPEGDGWSA